MFNFEVDVVIFYVLIPTFSFLIVTQRLHNTDVAGAGGGRGEKYVGSRSTGRVRFLRKRFCLFLATRQKPPPQRT